MKFITAAKTSARIMPFWPPKARPINIRSSVSAVSRNAVLKVFPIDEVSLHLMVLHCWGIHARHYRDSLPQIGSVFLSEAKDLCNPRRNGQVLRPAKDADLRMTDLTYRWSRTVGLA